MKTVTTTVQQDIRRLATPSAWLHLLHIVFPDGTTFDAVPNPDPITFMGVTYLPFACEIGNANSDMQGGLPELEIKIQNVTRNMSALVESKELRGTWVRIIIVNSARIADPTALVENQIYTVNEYTITEEVLTVRLGHDQLLSQRAPYGRILRDNCRWIYNMPTGRSPECGYVDFVGMGTLTTTGTLVYWASALGQDMRQLFVPGDSLVIPVSGQWRVVDHVVDQNNLYVTEAYSPDLTAQAYAVQKATCAKTLEGPNGCRAHKNQTRFGGFPGIPVKQGVG